MSTERKYPRPKILCDCGNYKILCWGEKIKPYLRHKADENCENNSGESDEHSIAKKILVDFLNENSKDIEFKKKCTCCQDISFPENIYKFLEEITNTKDNKTRYIMN
uniref:Uncharacterized protein n=1 Tax=viral metagenome TaxID=1070528 RepID=A0A6C0AD44_9ZZZZ